MVDISGGRSLPRKAPKSKVRGMPSRTSCIKPAAQSRVCQSPATSRAPLKTSSQHRYYQRYQIAEPYLQDDWKGGPRLTVNLGLRISLFGTCREKNHSAWNWVRSKFNKGAFTVDPVLETLVDAATSKIVSFDASTFQLPSDVMANLGLVQCGVKGTPSGCMKGHLFNPAPRIGFAWDPLGDGKTSIRGGYGIFFEHGTGNEANTGFLVVI